MIISNILIEKHVLSPNTVKLSFKTTSKNNQISGILALEKSGTKWDLDLDARLTQWQNR